MIPRTQIYLLEYHNQFLYIYDSQLSQRYLAWGELHGYLAMMRGSPF